MACSRWSWVARGAIAILLTGAGARAAAAQPGWLPRVVNMGANLTGANREAAVAHLESVERLLKDVPEFAHPRGFEVKPYFTGMGRRTGQGDTEHSNYVVQYFFRVNFFAPSFAASKNAIGAIIIGINADENMRGDLDPQGRTIFVEQSRWPLLPYAVATYGVSPSGALQPTEDFSLWAWYTAGGQLPWLPVSREDYYNSIIASAEGNHGERRAEYQKANEKTPYQQWIAEAPQRKKDREETLKAVAAVQTPAEVAKLRKAMEDAEREAGEQFAKNEHQDREDATSAFAPTDKMRAELNRMTLAQRKMPAIVDTDPSKTEWRATGASMRDRDTVTTTVHRVLTPNYDFWRARRSPAEVRTINVYFEASSNPAVQNAVYQAVKKLNWRALAAMTDQAPPQ